MNLFSNCLNCLSFSYTQKDIANTINNTYQMVLDRYNKLANEGKYQASPFDMETILLVIEEISLMDKQTMKVLRNIMAISRAVNVYVLFTCQRPDNTVIDNVVKSLVSNRIVLKCEDKKNSLIALDSDEACTLTNKGEGYYKVNGNMYHFQSYYLKDEVVSEIIKSNSKSININIESEAQVDDTSWISNL